MKKVTVTIILISLLVGISIDLCLPSIPAIQAIFSAKHYVTQLVVSAFLVGYGLGQLVWGTLSDWQGRIKSLAIGLSLYLVTTFFILYASSINTLIALRALQGFFASVAPVSAFALAVFVNLVVA